MLGLEVHGRGHAATQSQALGHLAKGIVHTEGSHHLPEPADLGEFLRKLVAACEAQPLKEPGQYVNWVEHGLRESPEWCEQCSPG